MIINNDLAFPTTEQSLQEVSFELVSNFLFSLRCKSHHQSRNTPWIQHFFTPSLYSISSQYMGNSFLEPDITNFSVTAINNVHVRQTGERSAFASGRQCL